MPRVSVKGAARDALRAEKRLVKDSAASMRDTARAAGMVVLPPDGSQSKVADSFQNLAQKIGVGADNALTTATYGFNPITRNHTLLEWIHRGSWIGGVAIDVIADDMTRAGITYNGETDPGDLEEVDREVTNLGIWNKACECIKWGRLYGGAIAVMLIDGQDVTTPLNMETIGEGMFKGLLVLDRWQLEPTLEDLVTDLGPELGLPKFYRVNSNAPAFRGKAIHHSRVAFRAVGVKLPYQQQLTENLWGVSVFERLWDRMIGYDSASTGAAQLVYKAYLRTLSIKGMREIAAGSEQALNGLVKYTDMMRRYQNLEGITLIDAEDTFEVQQTSAMTGIADALASFAEQLAGALQIPLTRLFGQSPKGFSEGDNDVRNYHDNIHQKQMEVLHGGMSKVYQATALSKGIDLSDDFSLDFAPLGELTAMDKATIAKTMSETVLSAKDGGLISPQVTLQELQQIARLTGVFSFITQELIDEADEEVAPPLPEGTQLDPETGQPAPSAAVSMKQQEAQGGQDDSQPTQDAALPRRKERRSALRG